MRECIGKTLRGLLCAALVLAHCGGAAAAEVKRVEVELIAPEDVQALLRQHIRILGGGEQTLPENDAARAALTRRMRREVSDLLAAEGYFSPTVRLDRSEAGRWRVTVEPGARTAVTEVTLSFEGELGESEAGKGEVGKDDPKRVAALRAAWRLPVGHFFRQADWDEAKQQLLDEVSAHRYVAARIVQSRAEIDPDTATAKLAVTLDSGPPFFLGPLETEGLADLPADFVERYNTLEEGRPYDRDMLLAFQRVLQNTPQLASATVDIERDPSQAAAAPVRVRVVEAEPKRLGFGTGFSSNTGYRVEATYRDVNLAGAGWELSSGARLEQKRQSAYADIFLPPPRNARYRDSIGASIERSDLEGLWQQTEAVGVARTVRRGNIETKLALRFQREELRPDGAEPSSQDALTLNWTWVQRAVDSLLDPRTGRVLEFQLGGGTSAASIDQNFFRLYGRYVHYQPIGEKDNLILRAEGGITLATSRDGVPQDFLFRTGGTQTVRGYAYQSLGVEDGDATVGGRYLGVTSAEYVHWLDQQWGAAFFVDAGDAADSREEFRLRVGYGAGARWRSPAGPLAVDLAWGQDDRRLRLHFGVAIAF